jgi:hypothetical protein
MNYFALYLTTYIHIEKCFKQSYGELHNELLWETWNGLGLKSSGMRHYVDGSVLPDIVKALHSFKTLERAHPVT